MARAKKKLVNIDSIKLSNDILIEMVKNKEIKLCDFFKQAKKDALINKSFYVNS
jgi:hypothetical protein